MGTGSKLGFLLNPTIFRKQEISTLRGNIPDDMGENHGPDHSFQKNRLQSNNIFITESTIISHFSYIIKPFVFTFNSTAKSNNKSHNQLEIIKSKAQYNKNMSNLILPADEKQPMILCQKSSEFDLWDS